VGETHYLLGVTANNISMLSEIPWDAVDGAGEEAILQETEGKPAFREAFFDALRQKTRR
jgi:flagellar biogenesis protein FliO